MNEYRSKNFKKSAIAITLLILSLSPFSFSAERLVVGELFTNFS